MTSICAMNEWNNYAASAIRQLAGDAYIFQQENTPSCRYTFESRAFASRNARLHFTPRVLAAERSQMLPSLFQRQIYI